MVILCPCTIETDYVKMILNGWGVDESGYSAREIFEDVTVYENLKKFALKSNCNGIVIMTNSFDNENEVNKYLKKIEKEINSDNEFLYEVNYSVNKYDDVIIVDSKYVFCGIINFEPKTPTKNFTIDDGGLRKRY